VAASGAALGSRRIPVSERLLVSRRMSVRAEILTRARHFRPAWAMYNLAHYSRLRGNARRYKELGIRRSIVGPVSHRDISSPSDEVPWLDRPDARAAAAKLEEAEIPAALRGKLDRWIDEGYVVLDGFFSGERIDAINADLERQMEAGTVDYHYRGNRVPDAFRRSESIREAVTDPRLIEALSFLLGKPARLFQTINFIEGSQQHAHSDFFHMTTEPKGYLVAIWVALEDVQPGSGPLLYYPGSHRRPYVLTEDLDCGHGSALVAVEKGAAYDRKMEQVVAELGIEPVEFLPRKGDVLIWHANLIHGGKAIETPGATRRSLVAHYFADGVLCYHEATERPALIG
jgi:ectoine hydroxylase